jgi:hypothetical protein
MMPHGDGPLVALPPVLDFPLVRDFSGIALIGANLFIHQLDTVAQNRRNRLKCLDTIYYTYSLMRFEHADRLALLELDDGFFPFRGPAGDP